MNRSIFKKTLICSVLCLFVGAAPAAFGDFSGGTGSVLSGLVKRTMGSEVETTTAGKEKELNALLQEFADSETGPSV